MFCISVVAGLLPACGGSGNSDPNAATITSNPAIFYTQVVLKGTAANGLALSGVEVNAKCLGGSGTTSTQPDGTFNLYVTGNATLPCVLETTIPNSKRTLHAIAIHDTINLTPLTEMLSTRLMHNTMTTVFANPDLNSISQTVTDTSIKMAQVEVGKALVKLGNTDTIDNFYSTPLIAATLANRDGGDAQDKLIDSLTSHLDASLLDPLLKMLANAKSISDIVAVDNSTCLLTGQDGVSMICPDTFAADTSAKINILPAALLLPPGGVRNFAADINYPDNRTPIRQPVKWSVQEVDGGNIGMNGEYTAPAKAGTYHVQATREDFPSVSTTSTVIVDTPNRNFLPTLSVDRRVVNLKPGDKINLTANINYVPGVFYIRAPISWSVVEAEGGSISLQGSYTAPPIPGLYHAKVQRDDYPALSAVVDIHVSF